MRKFILTLSALAVVSLAHEGDSTKIKDSIAPDAIRGQNNYLILDKRGNQEGMAQSS